MPRPYETVISHLISGVSQFEVCVPGERESMCSFMYHIHVLTDLWMSLLYWTFNVPFQYNILDFLKTTPIFLFEYISKTPEQTNCTLTGTLQFYINLYSLSRNKYIDLTGLRLKHRAYSLNVDTGHKIYTSFYLQWSSSTSDMSIDTRQ